MNPGEALDEIKKELESLFGKGLTGVIVITARNKSNAPIIGMTKDHLSGFVDHICADDRVVKMLGVAGSKQKLFKWKKLIS